MKKQSTKRVLSLVLALVLVLGVLPVTAMASGNVASVTINGTTTEYASVQAAVDAAAVSGGTVKLLADVELDAQVDITSGSFTFDLAGYTLAYYSTGNVLYVDGATLTVTDSSAEKTGTLTPCGSSIYNSGIWLDSGSVTVDGAISNGGYRGLTVAGGTMTVNDFTTDEDVCIQGGELIINGGSMEQLDMSGGETIVNGGYFSTTSGITYLMYLNGGNITVNGGTWKFCDNYGIRFNSGDSYATLRGGIYTNGLKMSCAYGTGLDIYLPDLLDTGYSLYDDAGAQIEITDTTKKVSGYVVVSDTAPAPRVFNITYTLTGLTSSNSNTTIQKGYTFVTTLTAQDGYTAPSSIRVKMDGSTLSTSKYSYSGGTLMIMSSNITGDIELIATAVEKWTYTVVGSTAIIGSGDNTMTQSGTIYTKTYTAVPVGTDYELSVVGSSISSGSQSATVTFNVTTACDVTVTYDSSTGAVTVTGDGVEIPEPAKLVFYYDNTTTQWSSVYIYAWNDDGETTAAWPGDKMTLVSGETSIYYAEVSAESAYVIFNNNSGTQTANITISSINGNMYDHSDGSWSNYTPTGASDCTHASHNTSGNCTSCGAYVGHTYVNGTCACGATETVATTRVVYFRNTAGWSCPYIYTWTTTNGSTTNYTGTWPGVAMELVAGTSDLYCYTISTDAKNVIFNNGSGTQTNDLTLPNDGNDLYTYSTDSWSAYVCSHNYNSVVTPPTCTVAGYTTHTCSVCGDSYTDSETSATGVHTYVNGACTGCGKALIEPDSATLSLEGEVFYNIYFTVDDASSVKELGLITFNTEPTEGTIDNADCVLPGAEYNSTTNQYTAHTMGVPAKKLGDDLYIRIYAEMEDGSYIYSRMFSYSAKTYAYKKLSSTATDPDLKNLVIAMLNYGAEAQLALNYKTDSLVNADLTAEQKASIATYTSDMMASRTLADSVKAGNFANSGQFDYRSASMILDGALAINYRFIPTNTPDDGITLYYWDTATYNQVDVMTKDNATGSISMELIEGYYTWAYTGLAAKELDETIYVVAVYTSGGEEYTTEVITYSLATYCNSASSKGTVYKALGEATVVYSYYAKIYFQNQ